MIREICRKFDGSPIRSEGGRVDLIPTADMAHDDVLSRSWGSMDIERVLFLTGAVLAHGIVGYALVEAFTDVNPSAGFALGILPDADFFFPAVWGAPFIHRGITHTLLFVIVVIAVAALFRSSRQVELASGLAVGSHLVIDSGSPMGVQWLFPLGIRVSGNIPIHGLSGTILWGTLSVGLLVWQGQPLSSSSDTQ